MQTAIQESQRRAAKHSLSVLRACGVGPQSDEQAVRQVLQAYLRTFGKQINPSVTAARELLEQYGEQTQALGLYGWLTRISKQ